MWPLVALAEEPPFTAAEEREILLRLEQSEVDQRELTQARVVIDQGKVLVKTLREQIAALEHTVQTQQDVIQTAERISVLEMKAVDRLERLVVLERDRADRAEARAERAQKTAFWGTGGGFLLGLLAAVAAVAF